MKKSKIFIAGAGGLGCPISIYLAVAGVGTITLADMDVVDQTNLNRQILHYDRDIGKKKTSSAGEKLREINPDIRVKVIDTTIDETNVLGLSRQCRWHRGRDGQFPHPLPPQRSGSNKEHPALPWRDTRVIRAGNDHPPGGDSVSQVHLPERSTKGSLPGGRGDPRAHRDGAGNRSTEISHPRRQAPDRPALPLGRPGSTCGGDLR